MMDIKTLHGLFLSHPSVFTDSRKVIDGGIFFALKGEHFNGNQFAISSIEYGAAYAVVDEPVDHPQCIQVEDVLKTLQDLAHFHRVFLGLPIVAITGSNGKTTTKELLFAVLSQKYKTKATLGNLNNHIGVPLTLLSMDSSTEMGIVEMGANHIGEIASLCAIAAPDFGYITNFGKAHLEGFGSIEGVIKGKSELYEDLKKRQKLIFLNSSDALQVDLLKEYPNTYRFGTLPSDHCQISNCTSSTVCATYDQLKIQTQLIGAYNFNNLAAATAVGSFFEIQSDLIASAIAGYQPQNNRSQLIISKDNTIILDAYNANPTSMQAALDNLAQTENSKKVVILGDMLELGDASEIEHQCIADLVESMQLFAAYFVGPQFFKTNTASAIKFESIDTLKKHLEANPLLQSVVLIKGSRGMALERLIPLIH